MQKAPPRRIAKSMLDYLDRRLGAHAGSGPEYTYFCPACIDRIGSEANTKKFAVNIDRRKGQCFRCEFKFREIAHLFRYINGGFITPEERVLLREDPPIVVGSVRETVMRVLYGDDEENKGLRIQKLPNEYEALSAKTQRRPAFKRAHHYLEGRNVDLATIERFQVGYCPRGEYQGYLIFPVVQNGALVYWTSRYAGRRDRMKSKNPPKRDGFYSRQHCLLNYDNVVGRKIVGLVEGPFDCMAPKHALGLMGRVMSPVQETLIADLVEHGLRELVLMLDPGTGRDMDHVRASLCDVVPRITMLPLDHGDPASRKADLPALMQERRVPSLVDRIRSRFGTK